MGYHKDCEHYAREDGKYSDGDHCPDCGGKSFCASGDYDNYDEVRCDDCGNPVSDEEMRNACFDDCENCGAEWVPAGNKKDNQPRRECSECERLICRSCEAKWTRGYSSLENRTTCKECAKRVQYLPLPGVPSFELEEAA